MGASDSKLVFKQGIFRLSEQQQISPADAYWKSFWELPETPEDVFSLFSPADIRRVRDSNLRNLETLLLAVTSRLFVLRNHPSFPDPELAAEREALNCIRVLTRVLPFVYEADDLEVWEGKFFWGARRKRSRQAQIRRRNKQQRDNGEVLFDGSASPKEDEPPAAVQEGDEAEFEDAKPLAEELIDTIIDLLFFSDFTLPRVPAGKNKVSHAIWQSGVGCNHAVGSTKELESNRIEVLRLLLVITSRSMYIPGNVLPVKGVRAITYISTCPDKQIVLSMLCSFLNTTLKYNPTSWRIPYDHVVIKDPKQILVTYCLQLLLVLILYPIPETDSGAAQKNFFRYYLGRLHRPQDFQFMVDGITKVLNQPLEVTNSLLPGSQKSWNWAPEMMMLFWEILQCNKRFRSFLIDTDRSYDFVILIFFYAVENRNNPTKQGLVRMCVFVLQTLSTELRFGKSLNKTFAGQESLPQSVRIPNFHGTYADYLISSIYTLLTSSKGKLDAIYPALLAIINNIAAYIEDLGRATSSKLIQLYASMSSPSFLLANDGNHALLHSLLEALNAVIEHNYSKNPNLVYAIVSSRKRFQDLRHFTLESAQEEVERRNQARKEQGSPSPARSSTGRSGSVDSVRGIATGSRQSTLSNVPEETAFAIGDDDEEDDDGGSVASRPRQSAPSSAGGLPSGTNSPVAHSRRESFSSADDAVPAQLRGMSEKARGKLPAGQSSFSRQNSTTSLASTSTPILSTSVDRFAPSSGWVDSWLAELPLHSILTVIDELVPHLPAAPSRLDTTTSTSTAPSNASRQTAEFKAVVARMRSNPDLHLTPAPIRVHLFEWTPLSLGWYESLLWSFIFSSEILFMKGSSAVWSGTMIRLFKVQETAAATPSLLAPRGGIDAVGSNLVQRFSGLGLRSASGGAGSVDSTATNSPTLRQQGFSQEGSAGGFQGSTVSSVRDV